jgi:hypothetical protein
MLYVPRGFKNGNGRTPLEFNSCEKLFISEGFLFLGALVACIMALKRGDSDSFGVSQVSYADCQLRCTCRGVSKRAKDGLLIIYL